MAICPGCPQDRIEGVKANWHFALPPRCDSHPFRASQRDMKAPSENELVVMILVVAIRLAIRQQYQSLYMKKVNIV
jgi:hypothetical protein